MRDFKHREPRELRGTEFERFSTQRHGDTKKHRGIIVERYKERKEKRVY